MTRCRAETAEAQAPDAAREFRDRTGDTREGRGGGPVRRDDARPRAAQAAIDPADRPSVTSGGYKVCPPGSSRSKPQTLRAGRRRDRQLAAFFYFRNRRGFSDPRCPAPPRIFSRPGR
jgi:hypothetical protein